MSEIISLARLLIRRHRRTWFGFMSVFGVLLAGVMIYKTALAAPMSGIEVMMLTAVMPAGIGVLWGVLLLDFYRASDVTGLAGMYDGWLLRTPIATWKLALVPLLGKSVWLFAMSGILATVAAFDEGGSFELLGVLMWGTMMSIVGISVSAMLWRPVRNEWSRLIWLAITLTISMFAVALAAMGMAMPWELKMRIASGVSLLLLAGGVCWLAYRSLELSRSHAMGLVGAEPAAFSFGTSVKANLNGEHRFNSTEAALAWHDRTRSKRVAGSYLRWFAIGFFLLLASLAPPFGAWLAMTIVLWLVIVSLAGSSMIEPTVWGTRSSLPDYLLASPISVDTLAWDRLRFSFIAAMKMGVIILACSAAGFFAIGYQHTALEGWGLSSLETLKPGLTPSDHSVLLIRSMAAIGLSAITLLVTFIPSTVAASASGRNSVGVWLSVIYVGGLMVIVAVSLRWFLGHSDWESIQKDLASIPAWLPTIAAVGLWAKAAALATAAVMAIGRGDLKPSQALWMTAAWAALVICVGFAVGLLAPHRWITPLRSTVALATLVPLAGMLLMPTMVRWNLHR